MLPILKAINDNSYDFINKYKLNKKIKNLIVYPIIVYTDTSLNARGINYFVLNEFRKLTLDQKYNFELKNLVMIHSDFLVLWRTFLKLKKVNFINILDRFIKHIIKNEKKTFERNNSNVKAFDTFEDFFEYYIYSERKMKITGVDEFKEIYREVFPDK